MTVEARRQRRSGEAGLSRLPSARLLVAIAVCVLGLDSGPALAQGSRPEPAPIKAPAKLGPEPAPAARAAPPTTVSTSAPASSASQRTPATTPRPSVVVTSAAAAPAQPRPTATSRTKPKPPPSVPASPKSTNAVKSFADAIPSSATRVAVGAVPAGSGNSTNHLLFLGGLALLVLVLSDAALLGLSARALREPADR